MKVLVVVINDRLYGFELGKTRRIVPDIKYSPIPFVPDIFKGLTIVMGELTIIVSLNKILGIDEFKRKEELYLLIKGKENDWGFPIHNIHDIVSVQESEIEELEDPFVVGDFKLGENVVPLIDTEKIEEHLYESIPNFQE